MPPDPLEAFASGSRLGNRSVFILDPRLSIVLFYLLVTNVHCINKPDAVDSH